MGFMTLVTLFSSNAQARSAIEGPIGFPHSRGDWMDTLEARYADARRDGFRLWNLRVENEHRALHGNLFESFVDLRMADATLKDSAWRSLRRLSQLVSVEEVPTDLRVQSAVKLGLVCRVPVLRDECHRQYLRLSALPKKGAYSYDYAQVMRNISPAAIPGAQEEQAGGATMSAADENLLELPSRLRFAALADNH